MVPSNASRLGKISGVVHQQNDLELHSDVAVYTILMITVCNRDKFKT